MTELLDFGLSEEEESVFCQEAEELIQGLDENLVALEKAGEEPEIIQSIFRATHTIKGSAAVIGHHRMANLAHCMETALDLLRNGRLAASPELVDVLLQSVDTLRLLNGEVSSHQYSGVEPDGLIASLQAITPAGEAAGSNAPAPGAPTAGAAIPPADEAPATGPETQAVVRVTAQIAHDSVAPAARAMQVILAMEESGPVLWCDPSREAIERSTPMQRIELLVATAEAPAALQERLNHIGELEEVRIVQERDGSGETPESRSATGRAKTNAANGSNGKADVKTVRTSVERLDKLMNLVGELVTDRNRLLQTHASLKAEYEEGEELNELAQAISHLASITDELQEEVMRARMLPLEYVFNKFPRMVRDLARDAGKQVSFQIEGQETELDRSVIEEISDPLMHLLRNAIDHGIESRAQRLAAGKPETGVIRLAGRSEGNHIVITVSDDGRGIDPQALRRVAVARAVITEEAAARLSDAEALDLIFLPGFSTAEKVTDVSGRGVGMDVVRNNIERLHGSVQLQTVIGQGTTFELGLPLTLAIMPTLLVALCGDTYCIPLSSVIEVLKIRPQDIHCVDGGELILWRGKTLPLLRLTDLFGLRSPAPDAAADTNGGSRQGLPVVAARWGEESVGLVVDQLLGQQEIVIKNLGRMIGQVMGTSGGAVLGDGSVALIVDVPGLVKWAAHQRNSHGVNRTGR